MFLIRVIVALTVIAAVFVLAGILCQQPVLMAGQKVQLRSVRNLFLVDGLRAEANWPNEKLTHQRAILFISKTAAKHCLPGG